MDKRLNELKNQYVQIKASSELKERVEQMMKKAEKRNKRGRSVSIGWGIAAAACVCLVLTFNLVPTLSVSAQNVPIVKQIVNVLTLGRFEIKDGNTEASIATPQIVGLENKELEDRLNREFKEYAEVVKEQFVNDARELKELEKAEGSEAHLGVDMDYRVLTDNDDILAIDVYVLTTVGSSSTKHTYYNIDKKDGTLLTLEKIYAKKSGWHEKIEKYIWSEMNRRNIEEEAMYWEADDEFGGEFAREAVQGFDKFYIDENGRTVICFDKYEIAPGAQGSSEFVIPEGLIK